MFNYQNADQLIFIFNKESMKKILFRISIAVVLSFGLMGIAQTYTVQSGDSLSKIAVKSKLSLQQLIRLNPQVANPSLIFPGEQINTNGSGQKLGGTQPVAGFNYYLAGSGVTGSNGSITLQSLTIPQTGYLLQDSDFSNTFYITLEPGNAKKQEIAGCTTVTQNANGTATLSGCSRGLLPFSPYTASSTYAFTHAGGTTVIFSDPPQLFNQYPAKDNNETITGQWSFSQLPTSTTSTPTDPSQLITLYQFQQATSTGGINASELVKGVSQLATGVQAQSGTSLGSTGARLVLPNSLSNATSSATILVPITNSNGKLHNSFGGATSSLATLDTNVLVVQNPTNATSTPTANKIPIATASGTLDTWVNDNIQNFTTAENFAASSTALAVYAGYTDGKLYHTGATVGTSTYGFVGFIQPGVSAATSSLIAVQTAGIMNGFTGLATGTTYYLSNTSSTISATVGTFAYKIGKAVSSTALLINKGLKVANGTTSFSATATTTIILGFRPQKISIYATIATGNSFFSESSGGWDENNGDNCVFGTYTAGTAGVGTSGDAWRVNDNGTSNSEIGSVVNVAETDFQLANVETGSITPSVNIFWQATAE